MKPMPEKCYMFYWVARLLSLFLGFTFGISAWVLSSDEAVGILIGLAGTCFGLVLYKGPTCRM